MSSPELTNRIKQKARQLGFGLCGVCPAAGPPGAARLDDWLARGYAGEMGYLEERRAAYDHPRHVLEGVRSIVMLAMDYRTEQPQPTGPGQGRVSRYAWGDGDYHDLIRHRLHALADDLRAAVPAAKTRGVVDTAPLLEREFAQLAGLGWVGKNTLLLNRQRGSYFFLAGLLTDQLLEFDVSHEADHCGSCTACLEACPTNAFPEPYVLDASRCISYLTIEHRSAIAQDLRDDMADWVFGCDVCQDVCPWNRGAPISDVEAFEPRADNDPLELAPLFHMNDADFRARFRHTPLWRAHRRGLLRNAAIVLGNQRAANASAALVLGLCDPEPLVRGACAWALGQLATPAARRALERRRTVEPADEVRAEITAALSSQP